MKKVDTHNMKMVGLKKASQFTDTDYSHGRYVQFAYDPSDGEIITKFHTQNSWSEFHDKNIIPAGGTTRKLTMQEIADKIFQAVQEYNSWN